MIPWEQVFDQPDSSDSSDFFPDASARRHLAHVSDIRLLGRLMYRILLSATSAPIRGEMAMRYLPTTLTLDLRASSAAAPTVLKLS